MSERSLDGRRALVTGAGQGIGRDVALALAEAGASVVVADRAVAGGAAVVDEIEAGGGRAVCVRADVRSRLDLDAAVAATVESFGGLEIMVQSSFRGSPPHRLEDAAVELWDANSTTAMWGSLHCARAAFPRLAEAGGRGRLILVTSAAAVEGSAAVPLFAAVQAGQRALADSLAREWGPSGVTVNCVTPVARTPSLTAAMSANPGLRTRLEARPALGRVGDADGERAVGEVVALLASDAAGHVTGQTLVCDGGSVLGR